MTESQIQQTVISKLSTLAIKHNFIFFAPLNETFMAMVKQFRIPDSKSRPMYEHMKKMGFEPGVSDIIIIWQGRAYFLELKKPGGEQSKAQILFSKNSRKVGAEYGTAHDWDEVRWCLGVWGIL